MAAPRTVLTLESLEERLTPATFGLAWPDPQHLTLSFVPDGTDLNSQPSQLFRDMNSHFATAVWEGEILRAYQTWAAVANINIGVVADGGQDMGTPGPLQGDARFGDIRVAEGPLASAPVALGTPFDFTAGTWSGDIVFNNAYPFTIGNQSRYDLFSVALHEAGHSLGLADNDRLDSVMFNRYDGTRTQLSAGDISAIRGLYGPRSPDQFALRYQNFSFDHAARLNLAGNGNGNGNDNGYQAIALQADVTTAGQADFYSFRVPTNAGGVTVKVQTSGISLLDPKVSIYDQSFHLVSTASATPGNDLSLRLNTPAAGSTYYVKVEGATGNVFGVGTYQLEVRPDSAGQTPANMVSDNGTGVEDTQDDSVFAGAKHLAQRAAGSSSRFEYTYQDSLASSSAQNHYRVRALPAADGSASTLTAVVWARQAGGLDPKITVTDAHGRPVAAQVIVNEDGNYVVQVVNTVPNQYYYVTVSAEDPRNHRSAGAYFLGVDFTIKALSLKALTQTTLTDATSQKVGSFKVLDTQTIHLVLSVNSPTAQVDVAVRLTLYDANHNVVMTLVAHNGQTQTTTLLLTSGTYYVRFSAATSDGSPLPDTIVNLSGIANLSDDLDPQIIEPGSGSGHPPPPPPPPPPIDTNVLWQDYATYSWLSLLDPFRNPFLNLPI